MIAGSYRSIPLRKTRSSFNVTASDTTEGMVACVGSVTPQSRPRLLITHGACSGVADGLLAMRFLPHKSFCMSFYHKTYSLQQTSPKSCRSFLVSIHRTERASSSSACRASSRSCTSLRTVLDIALVPDLGDYETL